MSVSAPLQHGESSDAIENELNSDKVMVGVEVVKRHRPTTEAKIARLRARIAEAERALSEGRCVSWEDLRRKSKRVSFNSHRSVQKRRRK
jgi:hypothetical protein